MDLTGVTYGVTQVTRKECFDACGQAEHCAQAVFYCDDRSADEPSEWKDDSRCLCYPMNTASYLDQDGIGGSNFRFASIHCKSTPIVCTRPGDTTGYAIESEALEVPNFAVFLHGRRVRRGVRGHAESGPVLGFRAVHAERVHQRVLLLGWGGRPLLPGEHGVLLR